MENYEMGDMPENENPSDELAMEGADYESPEEESSPIEDLKSQIVGLDKDSLRELEATIADELSKQEDDEESEAPEIEEEAPSEEDGSDLMSMFS